MKTMYLIVFLGLLTCNKSYTQQPDLDSSLIAADTTLIHRVKDAYAKSHNALFKILKPKGSEAPYDFMHTDLGFNYHTYNGGIMDGYLLFSYFLLTHKNDVIAYELEVIVKHPSTTLKKHYTELLQPLFQTDTQGHFLPIKFNLDSLYAPLPGIEKRDDERADEFMNVAAYSVFENLYGDYPRSSQDHPYLHLTPEICEYILYSKNPASRLMAIKYFYCHPSEFNTSQKRAIEKRIRKLKRYPKQTEVYRSIVFKMRTRKIIRKLKNSKRCR